MENFLLKFNFYLDHPFKNAIKTVLLFGSIMLIIYFSSINFIPLGNFKSLTYVILLLAIIGMIFLGMLIVLFFLAPTVWEMLFKDPVFYRLITHDKEPDTFEDLTEKILFIRKTRKYQNKIVLYYVIPVLFLEFSVLLTRYFNYEKVFQVIFVFLILSACWGFISVLANDSKNTAKIKTENLIIRKKILLNIIFAIKFLIFTSAAAFYLLIPILILHEIHDEARLTPHKVYSDFLFLIIITFISGTSLIISENTKYFKMWSLYVSCMMVCHSLLTLDISSTITGNIIKGYKLGAMKNINITVDEEGCEIFKMSHFPISCGSAKIYEIKKINLLWRVGEAYLEFKNENNHKEKLIIDASHLKSIEFDTRPS